MAPHTPRFVSQRHLVESGLLAGLADRGSAQTVDIMTEAVLLGSS
jgi:hypothetical protein